MTSFEIPDAAVDAYDDGEALGQITADRTRGWPRRAAAIRSGLEAAWPHLLKAWVAVLKGPAAAAERVRAAVHGPDGTHLYLSTGCLHGDHEHCRCDTATTGAPKVPGRCKFCAAPCLCVCHTGPAVSHSDTQRSRTAPTGKPVAGACCGGDTCIGMCGRAARRTDEPWPYRECEHIRCEPHDDCQLVPWTREQVEHLRQVLSRAATRRGWRLRDERDPLARAVLAAGYRREHETLRDTVEAWRAWASPPPAVWDPGSVLAWLEHRADQAERRAGGQP